MRVRVRIRARVRVGLGLDADSSAKTTRAITSVSSSAVNTPSFHRGWSGASSFSLSSMAAWCDRGWGSIGVRGGGQGLGVGG